MLSTTATRPGSSAAFVSDAQRLNVALTRARSHLVVVGAAAVMQRAAPAFARALQWCRCVLFEVPSLINMRAGGVLGRMYRPRGCRRF